MTREEAKDTIAAAVAAIHAAYWAVCDSEGRAVDPRHLDAPSDLLDEAHDIALSVEAIADERGLSWADARDLI